MKVDIRSVADLGLAIRGVRKAAGVRQDDLAATLGLSKQFVLDLECGKPSIQMGCALPLFEEQGLRLVIEIPDSVGNSLDRLHEKCVGRVVRED